MVDPGRPAERLFCSTCAREVGELDDGSALPHPNRAGDDLCDGSGERVLDARELLLRAALAAQCASMRGAPPDNDTDHTFGGITP